MAMPPPTPQQQPQQQERSKPLHNFSLPFLKWGQQRVLRCVKVSDDHRSSSSSIPNGFGFQSKPTNFDSSNNHNPNLIQQNHISSDLRLNGGAAAKRLKVSPLLEEERPPPNINDDAAAAAARPWNLRTRRAACKAPLRIEDKRNLESPKRILEIDSPNRIETSLVKRQSVEPVKERIKFSVPLSKTEIEQDFMEIARIRPPRRPKKRPRIVQKYLDSIFPGLWLAEVTPDSYKVPEVPES
ncbi:hypothetical protein JCGZ_05909 [Jatropha curcas]|uniref:DUF1639 family protein n=1 Tax=Jatropha curcas TaxID=180498 RepID=A0A067JJI8_JATCU|nr:uncharacterized protein LOC105650695 [Jatropha curcas]KDP20140.1 hypothetical protein JCGZ_05909 [Jatropha curcas]